MIKHIVFFRLQDQAEGKNKAENAQIIKQQLLNLANYIPYLKRTEVGINIPNAPKTDFDICLQCEFDSWDELNNYAVHPKHLKVVEYITKVKSARSAVDYEI